MKKSLFVITSVILAAALCLSGCSFLTLPFLEEEDDEPKKRPAKDSEAQETVIVDESVSLEATESETENEVVTEETEEDVSDETEEDVSDEKKLPFFEDSMSFYFSSGAGAWATELTLNRDGSFSGSFHDSNMGETGEGYPHGTVYICNFSGEFSDVEKINDYSYKMTLSGVKTEHTEGEEWIEDEILYIASHPYGLDGGKEYILYLPDAPLDQLSEEFLTWWPGRWDYDSEPKTTLSCYGIYNVDAEYGFFTWE